MLRPAEGVIARYNGSLAYEDGAGAFNGDGPAGAADYLTEWGTTESSTPPAVAGARPVLYLVADLVAQGAGPPRLARVPALGDRRDVFIAPSAAAAATSFGPRPERTVEAAPAKPARSALHRGARGAAEQERPRGSSSGPALRFVFASLFFFVFSHVTGHSSAGGRRLLLS